MALARTREALNNSWDKNDPKDAQLIFHMAQIGRVQFFHDPLTFDTNDIQEISKTHDIVCKSYTDLWYRILTHNLPQYFPDAERFHHSSRTDWLLAFLEIFPSPDFIMATFQTQFLSDIYETARTPVALPVSEEFDATRMFRLVLREGRSLIRQLNEIEARAVELLSDLEDCQLLTSVPGIGPVNALIILAEAGDLRRFRHHRQFLKFCGVDLATCQCGMLRGQAKLSK